MLAGETLTGFLWTSQPQTARQFYEGALGLKFVSDAYLMIFESGPARVALVKSKDPIKPPPGTALGWHVADIRATVQELTGRGVVFERGELPHDDLGIWWPTPGQGVAWFLDPDGNRLSVSG
jgi:catechol 2,3-dioxygenase-like lactoylglutathione lyase family enzyme